MNLDATGTTQSLIDKLINESLGDVPAEWAPQIETFIRQYFHRIAPGDLAEFSLLDLRGAALAHWQLARQRIAGQPNIHVYNPDFEHHGWQSTHTIIEIVTDNMPFLVDSVSMALNRLDLTIYLTIHPVVRIERDDSGGLLRIVGRDPDNSESGSDSFMHFQVDRQTEATVLDSIETELYTVLGDVTRATTDWVEMRSRILNIVTELEDRPPPLDADMVAEAAAFCRWIEADHFTLLGYCECDLNNGALTLTPGSDLGILRGVTDSVDMLPINSPDYGKHHRLLAVTKANRRSTIHRPAYMDYIGVKRYGADGQVDGERCVLGLFTSANYNRNTRDIPLLRQKTARVLARSGLPAAGHAARALQNIFEVYPRDSLFQINEEQLFEISTGILNLQERQQIRLFTRRDDYGRFYSCLVYVPRDRYNRELRIRIQKIFLDAFNGIGVEFNTYFSESVLARIHYLIHTEPGIGPDVTDKVLEQRIVETARSWQDDLRDAVIEKFGEEQGNRYSRRYSNAFPSGYQDDFPARAAAFDIERTESTLESGELGISLYRSLLDTDGRVRLKLYTEDKAVSPSDALPVIENMGLKVLTERPYDLHLRDGKVVWIHEFHLVHAHGKAIDPDRSGESFQEAFGRIWRGDAENDGFNRLVLGAGLGWRETAILRAYCKYLRQIRIRYSEAYMVESLATNPNMAGRLVNLFHTYFDPALVDNFEADTAKLLEFIEERLDAVANLDEDRILRSFLNVIQSTIRTNYYQTDSNGEPKPYISFKINPAHITRMPEPRPMFEIFVYSPRTEAVHLRGGRVARGGLRWSDRREDFRTEVLGLVKAQIVKNAVIVPVGSKGGFVVKQPPLGGDRESLMQEVVDCYKIFISGMLDITDNLRGNDVIPPSDVVRHDGDDPYLVIAADKGTATFSDIANQVAIEYGYWLGDAFASGGSIGYDHKKMGITARGAWESVKRHFRELGVDIQSTPFTVIGIGDMAGDVFGNGMLLSPHIKLLGAFNHRHIFLDPDPDPAVSFVERQRLFDLPRSAWTDYDSTIISQGGGIFPRNVKSITLTAEVQSMLRIKADKMTPNELINAMLKAPVDLLWNGGIGTYVKAAKEGHDDVGDRANDTVRVNGKELRCRVFGEGGNLGMTQLGRVEFSRNGGYCYTDSIDNSAGVDTSDHEVNIKILLNSIVADGDMTAKQRHQLLTEMENEVAQLVLRDNYGQSQAISVAAAHAAALLPEHARFIRSLERRGRLDRELEFLPDEEAIAERQANQQGLTRPELAILLSYSKIQLYDRLLQSDVPEDSFLQHDLGNYFPKVLSERYSEQMSQHKLKREIIATHITNSMVNRVGPTFAFRLSEVSGVDFADIARAYTAARQIFRLRSTWKRVEELDNAVPAQTQIRMLIDAGGLIERATLWLLRNRRAPIDIAKTVKFFEDGVAELIASLPKPLAAENRLRLKKRTRKLVADGVSTPLATEVSEFVSLSSALDIVDVAKTADRGIVDVASIYFMLGAKLEFLWLRDRVADLPVHNQWHSLAQSSLRSDLHNQQRELTADVLRTSDSGRPQTIVDKWVAQNQSAYDRFTQLIAELKGLTQVDFAMLSVALSESQSLRSAVE